jgi:integrase
MAYPDKKGGKATGSFVGEWTKGKKKRRFKLMRDAEDYEKFCKLFGREPPTIEDAANPTGAPTFAEVAERAKKAGGPNGKWKLERDHSLRQRLDYCISIIGPYEIQRVTRAVLRKITDSLDGRTTSTKGRKLMGELSNGTKNRYLSAAHAVLTYAHNEEILAEHPPVAPFLNESETMQERDILEDGEDEAVLRLMREAGDTREALCIEALLETGMRRGELCEQLTPEQITIEQVTAKDGTIVHVGVIRLHKGQTKNNKARVVILSAALARQIRLMIAEGNMPTGIRVATTFKRAVKRAGIKGNVVTHSLRHTRITRLRDIGVDKDIRKQLVGHESDDVHSRYGKVGLAAQLEIAQKLEDRAGKQRENAAAHAAQVIDFTKVG